MSKIFAIFKWPVLVLCIHIMLSHSGGYYWWVHVDKVMHLLGGISVAAGTMTAMQYARQKQWLGSTHPLLLMFLIVAIVGFAAIGWEFFEFILDDAFRTYMQPSVADTMGDLLCGLIGGAIIAVSKILFTQSTKRGL